MSGSNISSTCLSTGDQLFVIICLSQFSISMTSEYKKAKEAFVSGMTGSTMSHIHAISLVSLASTAESDFDASGTYKFCSGLHHPLLCSTNA